MTIMKRANLSTYSKYDLRELLSSMKEPEWRAEQILQWIHGFQVTRFEDMHNLSKNLRQKLDMNNIIAFPPLNYTAISHDQTHKLLFKLDDQNLIETVYIPETKRATLCISSQVGCVFKCPFCATGQQGFTRNLTISEIIGQVWHAKKMVLTKKLQPISNIVFMGMGEPMANLDNVLSTIEMLLDDRLYDLSRKKITVSTSGIVPQIQKLKRLDVNLAISLHAPNNTLRNTLVPINQRYPIETLLTACWDYASNWKKRSITFEYVMLKGINDSIENAKELVHILSRKPAKVNLIPFNTIQKSIYETSSLDTITKFANHLIEHNIFTTIRKNRGNDINAACGQLSGLQSTQISTIQQDEEINMETAGFEPAS